LKPLIAGKEIDALARHGAMGQFVELRAADGFSLQAWRAEPPGAPRGGLVVVQENAGLTPHILELTGRFAAQGYAAVAPAFYDRVQRNAVFGYGPGELEARRAMRERVPEAKLLLDAAAAVESLRPHGTVGIVGYCWGGSVAWRAACRVAGIACAVCYYGSAITRMLAEQPNCPVMFHWGEDDRTVSLEDMKKVALAHPSAQSFFYKAGHAFNNDTTAQYEPASARLALERTLAFLHRHVG
jgi:carboxymethylenebutenolidase